MYSWPSIVYGTNVRTGAASRTARATQCQIWSCVPLAASERIRDRPQRRRPFLVRQAGDHDVAVDECHVGDGLRPRILPRRRVRLRRVGEADRRVLDVVEREQRQLARRVDAHDQRRGVRAAAARGGHIHVLRDGFTVTSLIRISPGITPSSAASFGSMPWTSTRRPARACYRPCRARQWRRPSSRRQTARRPVRT